MNTPQPQIKSPQDSDTMITARDLFAALEEKRNDFKLDRWSIISDIVKAREEIEIFESGGFDGDTIIHVPDLSERSARGDLDGEGDDNDVSATDQVIPDVVSEGGHDEGNEARPVGSATASPTGLVPGEKSQTGHRNSGQSSADVERNMRNQSAAQHVNNTFSTTMDDYAQATAEQAGPAMTVDSHPFGGQPNPDRAAPRLQPINMPHDLTGYPSHSSRQHQEALAHQWLATESSTGYVSNGYGLDNLHSHTPISAQSFDASLLHGSMQEMSIPNGLPMMDAMSYDEFPADSRTLPVRAMSTPHPIMLDQVVHGAHGLGVIQSAFYNN
jgi:hypothetical protein